MRGGKRIVDIDVAERGKLFGEGRIVLLLAIVVAKIFQHDDFARLNASMPRSTFSPTQSSTKVTLVSGISSAILSAIAFSVVSFIVPVLGRPRCDSTTTLAPPSEAF